MSSYQRRAPINNNRNNQQQRPPGDVHPPHPSRAYLVDPINPLQQQVSHAHYNPPQAHPPFQGNRNQMNYYTTNNNSSKLPSANANIGSNLRNGPQNNNYKQQQFNRRPYSTASSRRIVAFPQQQQQQQQQQQHHHHHHHHQQQPQLQRHYGQPNTSSSPAKNTKPPASQPKPEDTLAYYKFDEVTRAHFAALDIEPAFVEDLLSPGKGVCYLTQIMTIAENQFKTNCNVKFDSRAVEGFWVGFLTINFPQEKTFTCKHKNKKESKNLCSLAAVYHLRKSSAVDSKLKLNIDTSVTNSFLDNSRGPITLTPIPMNIKQQMMSFTGKFDEYVANLIEYRIEAAKCKYESCDIGGAEGKHSAVLEGLDLDEGINESEGKALDPERIIVPSSGPIDIFTSRLYNPPDPRKKAYAFTLLKRVYDRKDRKYKEDEQFYNMLRSQERLPVRSMKETVIETICNNRTIVIAGDTGSGKSTQVPQFILENFIQDESNTNNFVNIAITQPRRISAISLAERVATELGEDSAGHTVGHSVRFDSRQPDRDINMMTYFTTGMLLKKIQRNQDLKGVTHLIVDEVHERDCTTDFLMILIKRLLNRRKDLRVIFMSASMDASLFARYFDNCPIISVSGRCYPVESLYLEDICRDMRLTIPWGEPREKAPKLNLNLLKDLITYVDETRGPGAVLCFMPGWKDMKSMQKELDGCRTRNRLKVMLVHSKLPISEQRLIFRRAEPDERKVILATNIAETSITIDDVRYVIDTGLCNSIDYDADMNISTFGTRWISKANAKQRSGRAGRTASGECFKLYSREEESCFQDFPFPELLRIPLESVIMEVKCHCPEEKAAIFLSQAIQHPSVSAIHNAIEELMLLGILNNREDLTVLGKRISDFSTHPRLSVSLVVSSALRCFYPVLNASAVLSSTQDPFMSALTDKGKIREAKERLCNEAIGARRDPINYMSDHIAFGNLLAQYDNASMSKLELDFFIEENNLNRSAMHNIQDCRNLYANMMLGSKFVGNYEWYSHDSFPNRNMNELEFVVASLAYSFYPKIVRVIRGLVRGGRMYPNKIAPTDAQTNSRVRFTSDSIVKNISLGKQLNSFVKDDGGDSDEESDYLSMSDVPEDKKPIFITYLNSRIDQESNQVVIRDGSVVPLITLLIFGGRELSIHDPNKGGDSNKNDHQNMVNISLDRLSLLSFRVSRDDALAIQEWRHVWQKYLSWYIHTKNTAEAVDSNDSIIAGTMNEFLELNKKLYASMR